MSKVFTITDGLENMGAMKTGGQGSVYKGRRKGEILTAIKLLPTPIHSESADDKNFTAFSNEVQKLKKVNEEPNPNVVKILSSGITDTGNLPFIEMEYIEGPDLEDLLKPPHDPIFTIKEVLKVADQLSNALAHCHKVGVRHGDIKSNNIKFNRHTGNYMLLDFGLAVMSDEQRRTSLRHAGAIEFMAPEQNEGQMLFETDVYSYGIILFELLAGRVPFPLKDNGETSRNHVMVAHMETSPPNLLTLRQQNLPSAWSESRKMQEMKVPEWLVSMIYKCLEKRPQNRFVNGVQLHEFIWQNSIHAGNSLITTDERTRLLEEENRRLKQQINQLLQQLQQNPTFANGAAVVHNQPTATDDYYTARRKRSSSSTALILAVVILALVGAGGYYLFTRNQQQGPAQTATEANQPSTKSIVGEYRVIAPRAYFHNEPDATTRRNAFAIPSGEVIKAYEDRNNFIYTEITNTKGQVSKGWLRKQDLQTVEEYNKAQQQANAQQVNQADIDAQLRTAAALLRSDKVDEALAIYELLVQQEVPEAQYQYADLALKERNTDIDCKQAFDLLSKAASKGYTPAKTTLGFLYSFADDRYVLEQNDYYNRCSFVKNVSRGSQLLIQAMIAGDSTAARYLHDLNGGKGN
jgi:eukaryotic-like serine/threonine-protein kinase